MNNANVPRGALSPVSVAGSDWSGISKYQSGNGPFGPLPGKENDAGSIKNPSPPSSVARSSDGTGLYASGEGGGQLKSMMLEEEVAQHHSALKKMLQPYLSQQGNMRPNKARDKLLRLSAIQFQELSTDVYDELERRNGVVDPGPPPADYPAFLQPKEEFHPKRNQARQKLSTLPMSRFRDLATDVFYELERRFPKFSSELGRMGLGLASPTNSMDGRGMPPIGPGMGPPRRIGSPGPGMSPRRGSPGQGMNGRPPPGPGYGPGPNGYRGPPGRGPPGPENAFGRPLPKTFQNNTIIPNKSTMVEDDDDDGMGDEEDDDAFGLDDPMRRASTSSRQTGGRRESSRSMASVNADRKIISDYQSKVESLQSKVSGLEASLEEKEQEVRELQERQANKDENDGWQELRQDLEDKLADAQSLNQNLQSEIDRMKADNAESETAMQQQLRGLRAEIERLENEAHRGGPGGDEKYNDLLRQHEELKAELREQEEVTEDVRREAMEFLTQMRAISERADMSAEREAKLHAEIEKLKDEVKSWKSRYTKTKATLRNLRSSSIGIPNSTGKTPLGKDANLVDSAGIVRAVHVTKFQISIDELLRIARSINYGQSLDAVKHVVMAARGITQDIEASRRDDDEDVQRLKSRVSATANNLTTAAKNHATGHGLSPVSLVDAAASHLTASIVELIKVVKIRPRQEGEDDDTELEQKFLQNVAEEEEILSPDSPHSPKFEAYSNGIPGIVSSEGSRMSAGGESVYSPASSPRTSRDRSRNGSALLGEKVGKESKNWGNQPVDYAVGKSEVEELRIFLENQTESIVESIQSLLGAIRADGELPLLRSHVSTISTVVGSVVAETHASIDRHHVLKERAEWIVDNLAGCRDKMIRMAEDGSGESDDEERDEVVASKEFKSRLAGLAFDMARETKELVRAVEDIDNEGRRLLQAGGGPDLS